MACFNDTNDTSLYPPFSTPGEFDTEQFLDQTSVTEETGVRTSTFADGWTVGNRPGYVAGETNGLRAEGNFESVSSVTSCTAQAHNYDHLIFPHHYWPIVGRCTRSNRPGTVSRENPFVSTEELEPTLSSIPLRYWGENESGLFTRALCRNIPTQRFHPYGTPHSHLDEQGNADVGPSTLVLPLTPYLTPATTNPSGGTPEAPADADNQINEAPTIKRPRGTGRSRKGRNRYEVDVLRLRVWAQRQRNLEKLPSHKTALGVALEAVKTNRLPVYAGPRLIKGTGKRTAEGKTAPDLEYEKRKGTRDSNEELSRYYELAPKQAAWGCPALLSRVLSYVEGLPESPSA